MRIFRWKGAENNGRERDDREGGKSYNRAAMGVQELTVERYEGVAEDQRILLLRGPITIETAPQKTGRCLVLTAIKPRVRKIMEITKVNDFFMTFATTWEAVEALANTGTA